MSNKANWVVGSLCQSRKVRIRKKLPQVCIECGALEPLAIDHKIPRSMGGTNHIGNLQMLCFNCNGLKCAEETIALRKAIEQGVLPQLLWLSRWVLCAHPCLCPSLRTPIRSVISL
jgi:5-methylcytosine-specific restriction endonuclease McrA